MIIARAINESKENATKLFNSFKENIINNSKIGKSIQVMK